MSKKPVGSARRDCGGSAREAKRARPSPRKRLRRIHAARMDPPKAGLATGGESASSLLDGSRESYKRLPDPPKKLLLRQGEGTVWDGERNPAGLRPAAISARGKIQAACSPPGNKKGLGKPRGCPALPRFLLDIAREAPYNKRAAGSRRGIGY